MAESIQIADMKAEILRLQQMLAAQQNVSSSPPLAPSPNPLASGAPEKGNMEEQQSECQNQSEKKEQVAPKTLPETSKTEKKEQITLNRPLEESKSEKTKPITLKRPREENKDLDGEELEDEDKGEGVINSSTHRPSYMKLSRRMTTSNAAELYPHMHKIWSSGVAGLLLKLCRKILKT